MNVMQMAAITDSIVLILLDAAVYAAASPADIDKWVVNAVVIGAS